MEIHCHLLLFTLSQIQFDADFAVTRLQIRQIVRRGQQFPGKSFDLIRIHTRKQKQLGHMSNPGVDSSVNPHQPPSFTGQLCAEVTAQAKYQD